MSGRYGIWSPGPPLKVWPDVNKHDGIILHSMEGSLPVALGMLNDPAQQVSWHFSIGLDGKVYQHYDLSQSPWHAGGRVNNARFIGIEHEGKAPGVIAGAQLGASIGLVKALAIEFGWKEARKGLGLFEHGQWTATTCPNGRIPWGSYDMVIAPAPPVVDIRPVEAIDRALAALREALEALREAQTSLGGKP